MSTQQRTNILFPVGRLVMGSLYKPRTTDAEGKPLVIKNGPDAGKPRVDYFIAVAIPKTDVAWHQTPWGAEILKAGYTAFPQAYQSPQFAWKIEDGDSQVPNKKGRKPCDNEGWPGNWVVKFSGGYAPKVVSSDGTQQITDPDAVKLGYYVQVYGNAAGNGSVSQPGVFINHNAVALAAYGPEIFVGLDTTAVGFGVGTALPAGASATPLSGGFNPAPAMVPPAAAPTVGIPAPMAAAPSMSAPSTLPTAVAPATMVAPSPAFLAAAMPSPPALPAAPAVPVEPALTPAGIAAGGSYAAFRAAGWTDVQMRQQGFIA